MPELPPPSQPTNHAVQGGTWASGPGNTQTSGTPADFAQYTQWATFEYTRNSNATTYSNPSEYRSLSFLSSTEYAPVNNTELHFKITVHNSCKIIKSHYTLSASLQMQKFTVMANKYDKVGYTYGEVSGASNQYVFGPQGSIVTTQPYIRRDVKTAADVPYSFTQVGSSHSLQTSGDYQVPCSNPTWGQCDLIGQDYGTYLLPYLYGDLGVGSKFPYARRLAGDTFSMYGGGYNTSSEPGFGDNAAGMTWLQTFIETNCGLLDNPWGSQRFGTPVPTVSDGYWTIQDGDRLAINPYYNTALHDYN